MKKLLVFTSTFPRHEDDAEPRFVFELTKRLAESFSTTVLCPHGAGLKTADWFDKIRILRFRYAPEALETLAYSGGITASIKSSPWKRLLVPFFLLGSLIRLLRELLADNVDCIHAHWIFPQGAIAAFAIKLSRRQTRLLITAHGGDLFGLKGFLFKKIKRYALNTADHISVVSSAMIPPLLDLGIPQSKISLAPMGTDLSTTFTPNPDIPRDFRLILFVGRLVEKKGVAYLIDAIEHLNRRRVPIRLDIVGDGPLRSILESKVSAQDLNSHIRFLGKKSHQELPDIYRRAGVFVMPSIEANDGDQEGFGLVLVEAAGCGCAIIASRLPATEETATYLPKVTLVQPGDSEALANAIFETVLITENPTKDMPTTGKTMQLDWRTVSHNYADMITRLCSSRHRSESI